MTGFVGYIAMSLDGFVADADGGVGWLDAYAGAIQHGGYDDFIAGIDALVIGRSTYEQVMGWGWPYGDRPAYVLTNQAGFTGDHVAAAGGINALRTAIGTARHSRVWIMGGGQAQRAALDGGLFDSLQVFVMPLLLGGGKPMMAPGAARSLNLVHSQTLPGGILKLTYKIGR